MKFISDCGMREYRTKRGTSYIRRYGIFECEYCGKSSTYMMGDGRRNKSCGCMKVRLSNKAKETHGDNRREKRSPLYGVWSSMKSRCQNENNKAFPRYGGRGISLCAAWGDYACFKEWAINNGYRHGLDIDRTDNNGNYEPLNCRFVERKTNRRNTSHTTLTETDVVEIYAMKPLWEAGVLSPTELGKKYGVSHNAIRCIFKGITWKDVTTGKKRAVDSL